MPYTQITHDSRHPFETYTLLACAIGGFFALFGDLWPGAIEEAFPFVIQNVWGFGLFGGASLALVGVTWKNRPTGIFMEQIGLISVAATCLTYAAALFTYSGSGAFATGALFTLVGLASVRQWWRLERFMRTSIRDGKRWRRNGR